MSAALPDKQYLYGRYQTHEDKAAALAHSNVAWQQTLAMKQAHKALDIPLEAAADDMQINSSTTHNHGMGKLPALILGAGMLAAGAGIPAALWMFRSSVPITAPAERVVERILTGDADVTVGPITIREVQ